MRSIDQHLSKLNNVCDQTGVIKSRKTLSEFVTGFTDSHGLFTFIMVSTRQQAAAKIKGEKVEIFS